MISPTSRPAFHFTASSGWINDPLGLTWKDGTYHLFYQYVPGRTSWASNCHWGHATSPDLIAWTEHGIAVPPGDGDDGVWSGSIVTDSDGRAIMFYTSVTEPDIGIGTVRTATPDDDSWDSWTKGSKLMTAPGPDVIAYRDPFVFRDGGRWRMFVGAGLDGGTAAALSYSSADLAEWTPDGIAAQRPGSETERVWTGTMWECPQLFEIDGSHVLVTSVWEDDVLHYVAYGVGSYADGKFKARSWGRLSYGKSYYAPSFFRDKDGAPSLIFWVRGVHSPSTGPDGEEWASALSVPHTLSLSGDTLVAVPHADLSIYSTPARFEHAGDSLFEAVLAAGADLRCTAASGIEIRLDTLERTLLSIKLGGNNARVTVPGNADFTDVACPLPEGSELRLIVDAGIVEVSGAEGILAVPLPLTDAPVTLAVRGSAAEPRLMTISGPASGQEVPRLARTSLPD